MKENLMRTSDNRQQQLKRPFGLTDLTPLATFVLIPAAYFTAPEELKLTVLFGLLSIFCMCLYISFSIENNVRFLTKSIRNKQTEKSERTAEKVQPVQYPFESE